MWVICVRDIAHFISALVDENNGCDAASFVLRKGNIRVHSLGISQSENKDQAGPITYIYILWKTKKN